MIRNVVLPVAMAAALAGAFDHSHAAWTAILKASTVERAGPSTAVDYAAIARDPAPLRAYLGSLSRVGAGEFRSWSSAQRLAFLINAYNAYTIELVVRNLPVKSIKDIGGLFSSPWKKRFIPLLGETISLDQIEHDRIRPVFGEPRVHFALVCASRSCPRLQRAAFVADSLPAQLERGAREFLSDRSRNRSTGKALEISRIFEWYGSDFGDQTRLRMFLDARMDLSPAEHAGLRSGTLPIRFLPYDWSLNDVR